MEQQQLKKWDSAEACARIEMPALIRQAPYVFEQAHADAEKCRVRWRITRTRFLELVLLGIWRTVRELHREVAELRKETRRATA